MTPWRGVMLCWLLLHSPDRLDFWVSSAAVTGLRPAAHHQDHIAAGTQAIVYVAGHGFGVRETEDELLNLKCSLKGPSWEPMNAARPDQAPARH